MTKTAIAFLPVLAGLGLFTLAGSARAEQFVLLDVTFTFTKADADNATPSKSHYYVKSDRLNPMTPVDWTQPVDYRNGRIHVRTEVMDKPAGSAETRWTLCYIARKGIDAGYGCSNTAAYKEEGVWQFEQGMTEWWQNDNIDWTQGIKQMDLVMKDSKGVFAHTMPDPERWFPTTLRITMIQVSAGSTYDESKVPNLPAGDGGAGGAGTSNGGTGGGVNAGSGGAGGSSSDPASSGAGGAAAAGAPAMGGGGAAGSATTPTSGTTNGGASGNPTGGPAEPTAPSPANPNEDAGCNFGSSAPSGHLGASVLALALAVAWRRRRRSA